MLGNYLQQTTSAGVIFQMHFFLGALRVDAILFGNYNMYGKCSKISNTLKLRTPKIIAENNFQNILKKRTLTFFGKVNF